MLNDAHKAVDDLAAICRQAIARDTPLDPIADEATRISAADLTAFEVANMLAAAAVCGIDVGAAMRRLLISEGVTE